MDLDAAGYGLLEVISQRLVNKRNSQNVEMWRADSFMTDKKKQDKENETQTA
jgi:hypothetical protein